MVLLGIVAAAAARPSGPIAAPAVAAYAAPSVGTYAAPAVGTYAAPAVATYAAPAVAAYAAPAVATYAAPAVAAYAAPAVTAYAAPVATAVTKTVHYASTPVVTGYTSQVKLRTFSKARVDWDDVKTDSIQSLQKYERELLVEKFQSPVRPSDKIRIRVKKIID